MPVTKHLGIRQQDDCYPRRPQATRSAWEFRNKHPVKYDPSRYRQVDILFAALEKRIGELRSLSVNWDSYGAPAPEEVSIKNALRALWKLHVDLLAPQKVVASAEGGIALYFNKSGRKACAIFGNAGDCDITFYGNNYETIVLELNPEKELSTLTKEVKKYFGSGNSE